ncbi:MFS transporter [Mycobacterium angelicum]|uniref:MFS transporter n=1 Tax=Mycobacterium angelicum TaxID=470074 RepID=A0A1W9ZNA9_MYCAN|nr:MFS transporter [Mycobacterium angelicum]MCV7200095.1 MFS transporter [Mycobacterium angelicum]ORA19125.1 MFS transporter [Mycobacterium angelicum]
MDFGLLRELRSFNRPCRVLMVNQLGTSLGFYLLMPYLSTYLGGQLGLAAWAVGLVLGMRNLSQQGMFFLGGTLADRIGCKPVIITGCLLHAGAFALLALAKSLPTLLIASAVTGFAGALLNPALRAYLAIEAGDRRIDAFATLNIFNRTGTFFGPLLGLVLLNLDFRLSALVASIVFALLGVALMSMLPRHRIDAIHEGSGPTSIFADWSSVARNWPFLRFAAVMLGAYVLSSQIYFALPLHASAVAPQFKSVLVAAVFGTSGLVAITCQLRITRWFSARWEPRESLLIGVMLLTASFVPLSIIPDAHRLGTPAAVLAFLASVALLAIASAVIFPVEMDMVVSLSRGRLVATYYGFYNTIIGLGMLAGYFAVGGLEEIARYLNNDEIVWGALTFVGIITAMGLYLQDRAVSAPARAVPD